jgi:hypothetical protein
LKQVVWTYIGVLVLLNLAHGLLLIFAGILVIGGPYLAPNLDTAAIGGQYPMIYALSYEGLGITSILLAYLCRRGSPPAFFVSAIFGLALIVSAAIVYTFVNVSFDPLDLVELPIDAAIVVAGFGGYSKQVNRTYPSGKGTVS